MRSKHLRPTLQLTVRSKVKPVSTTGETNLSKLMEVFGLDASPVLVSMPHLSLPFPLFQQTAHALILLLAIRGPKDIL